MELSLIQTLRLRTGLSLTVRGGIWTPCASHFDWHGGVSQNASAAPADRQYQSLGIKKRGKKRLRKEKKTRSPVCLKIILLQRGEFLRTYFLSQEEAAGNGSKLKESMFGTKFRSACLSVSEFGELSADAGSLGHLATAKENGKSVRLLRRGRLETNFFGQFRRFAPNRAGKAERRGLPRWFYLSGERGAAQAAPSLWSRFLRFH